MNENNVISVSREYYRKLEIGLYFLNIFLPLHFLYRLRASLSFDALLLISILAFYLFIFYRDAKSSIWALNFEFGEDCLYIDYYDGTKTVVDLREISSVDKKERFRRTITINYKDGKKTTLILTNPDAFTAVYNKLESHKAE